MRAAPALAVEVGVSLAWRLAQSWLWASAFGALCAWILARAGHAASLGLLAVVVSGLVAWKILRDAAAALAWDGQQWLLDGKPVHVTVALDLDRWLLLRLQGADDAARVRWMPATAAQVGTRWHGLRAALYSRAPESPLAATPPEGVAAPD